MEPKEVVKLTAVARAKDLSVDALVRATDGLKA
jgi:hypothetical protein